MPGAGHGIFTKGHHGERPVPVSEGAAPSTVRTAAAPRAG